MIEPDYMIGGLVRRGIPEHIARAFTAEAKSEAGLDPGINEQNPTVPGSRGGFGLMQWTGPRRRQLEAFAAERGVAPADPDLQMDFLVMELQGPESRAWQSIQSAGDTVSAARAITDTFLRPGIPRYDTRRKNAEEMAGFRAPPPSLQNPQTTANPGQTAQQPIARPQTPMIDPLAVYAQQVSQAPVMPQMQAQPLAQFAHPSKSIENQFAQLLGAAKGTQPYAR
jgi:Phage tail lysozyme